MKKGQIKGRRDGQEVNQERREIESLSMIFQVLVSEADSFEKFFSPLCIRCQKQNDNQNIFILTLNSGVCIFVFPSLGSCRRQLKNHKTLASSMMCDQSGCPSKTQSLPLHLSLRRQVSSWTRERKWHKITGMEVIWKVKK